MNTAQVRNAYAQSGSQAKIHPVKLIYMMYERLLVHLDVAKGAIEQNDIKVRGENLGKAIALLTELNASIAEDDDSEAASFLKGLYGAILSELPKVAIENDVQILNQSMQYVIRLKEIWEDTAMREYELTLQEKAKAVQRPASPVSKYNGEPASQGVSVSI